MTLKPAVRLALLLVLTAVVFLAYVILGTHYFGISPVVRELLRPGFDDPLQNNRVVWQLRMPRACGCVVVGAILGMVGSAFQALFRNPLAEPYIVGVSSGASVGGAIALVTGFGASWTGLAEGLGKTVLAFPAGLLTLAMVFAVAKRRGVVNIQTLLLAGVVTSAMLSAVLSYVLLAGGMDTRVLLQWLLGNIADLHFNSIDIMTAALVGGGLILVAYSKQLNAFALGEETAQRLGVNVGQLKPAVLIVGTAMVACTVGPVGIIGFLGLVAPHVARRTIGVDWRWSLIGSALYGSTFLLLSDLLAQRAINGGEIPVGIVTAIVGAPFLLVLLRRD